MKAHDAILTSLYELYKSHKDNPEDMERIRDIAWALEFDLGFDSYGYHELAELANAPAEARNQANHYTEVIESSLEKLKNN